MKRTYLNLLGISLFVFTACSQGSVDQRTASIANSKVNKIDEQKNSGDLKPSNPSADSCVLALVDENNIYQDQVLNFLVTSDDVQYQSFCQLIDTERADLGVFYLANENPLEDLREGLAPLYQKLQKHTQIFQGVVFTGDLNAKNRPQLKESLGFELELFKPVTDQTLVEIFPSLHSQKPFVLIVDGKGKAVLLPLQSLKMPGLIAVFKDVFKNPNLAEILDEVVPQPKPEPFSWDGLSDHIPRDWQLQDAGTTNVTN